MRDIPIKQDNVGDTLPAGDFNALNSELENAVTDTGQTLDASGGPDSDLNMLGKAMSMYGSGSESYADGGSANAYVLSRASTLKAPTEYFDGMKVIFFAANSNTGPSTINVVSLGTKDLVQTNGSALIADDIIAADVITAVYVLSADEFRLFGVTRVRNGEINDLINGDFDFWQRATSQTTDGYGSDDRWYNGISGATVTHSQASFTLGQTDVPNNPKYYSSTDVTTASSASEYASKEQRVEDVTKSSGKTKTLSFWAKANAARDIAVEFTQNFGTGGSPSSAVTALEVTTLSLTTSWQKFDVTVTFPSVSGKTLGTNGDDYYTVRFWFDAGSDYNAQTNSLGNQSGIFDLAQVQLEDGALVTPFEKRRLSKELLACKRYFQVLNGDPSAGNGRMGMGVVDTVSAAFASCSIFEMRAVPAMPSYTGTFTIYSGAASSSVMTALASNGMTRNMFAVYATGGSGLTVGNGCHLTASAGATIHLDAEL